MRRLVLIPLIFCTCKSKSLDNSARIKSIDSIVNSIKEKDSLDAYDWNGGIHSEDSTKDAIFVYAISMDTVSGELELGTIAKLLPESKHLLYFKNKKLIKAETFEPFADTIPVRQFYFENGKVLNASLNLNKDSIEKFYRSIADSNLKFANYYQSHVK